MADAYNLARFVEAQDAGGTYAQALAELRNGRKVSHWMWFVFPQIRGLGRSATARHYAVVSLDEARAYLAHPVLGPRLLECSETVAAFAESTATHIFGEIDALKLRSSMTLFNQADPEEPAFLRILEVFFAGQTDPATEAVLSDRSHHSNCAK